MKTRIAIFNPVMIMLAMFVSLISCNHPTQIVPFDIDVDEIFKPLEPNEESLPNDSTFGEEKIPGSTLEIEFKTDLEEVYVLFEDFTVLQISPAITRSLFEFVEQQLCEYGFVNQSFTLPKDEMINLQSQGLNYKEAAVKIINTLKEGFDAQLDNIASFDSPFNISFRIYPIYLDNRFVTYRLNAYAYTGGAHGISINYVKTYDLISGKFMSIDDIVKSDSMKEIRQYVVEQMAYSYPIYEDIKTVDQYLDSLNLFLGDFHGEGDPGESGLITMENYPLPNPGITSQGLVFIYQMYELTPASDGCPVVLLPYKDIRGCLKDNIGE